MKTIVTGCCGKIGLDISLALLRAGHEVVGLDQRTRPDAPFPVIADSLLDPYALHRALREAGARGGPVDAIVHLANHPNANVGPGDRILRENGMINSNVFLGAAGAGVPRVVFCSSVQAMLGGLDSGADMRMNRPDRFRIDETHPARPTNAYGLSKRLAEETLDALTGPHMRLSPAGEAPNLKAISIRAPFVLNEQAVGWNLQRSGRPASFEWGGAEAFAYVTLGDLARAFVGAVECPDDRINDHEIVFIAAPDPRPEEPIADLVERFYADVPGANKAIQADSFVDTGKAERLLGWRAEELLREMRRSPSQAPPGAP
ncbi:MAG: NAD(P)-dependent oxidoreductase [Phycisphaerales bacterium]